MHAKFCNQQTNISTLFLTPSSAQLTLGIRSAGIVWQTYIAHMVKLVVELLLFMEINVALENGLNIKTFCVESTTPNVHFGTKWLGVAVEF